MDESLKARQNKRHNSTYNKYTYTNFLNSARRANNTKGENTMMNQIIINVLTCLFIALIGGALTFIIRWLNKEIKNDFVSSVLDEIERAVNDAVLYVNQTYVDDLKEIDSFTDLDKKNALNMAVNAAITGLSNRAFTYINKNYDSIQGLLETKIEAAIKNFKKR